MIFNLIQPDAGGGKPEQEKTVNITENGTIEILPDIGKVLSKVIANVDIAKLELSGISNVQLVNIAPAKSTSTLQINNIKNAEMFVGWAEELDVNFADSIYAGFFRAHKGICMSCSAMENASEYPIRTYNLNVSYTNNQVTISFMDSDNLIFFVSNQNYHFIFGKQLYT